MVLFIQNIIFLLLMLLLTVGTKQKISSPSIAFILPFTISSIYLSFNISRWSVELSNVTTIVILSGCFSFLMGVIVSSCIYNLQKKRYILKSMKISQNISQSENIYVDKNLLRIFSLFQSGSILIVFRAILRVSRKYGYTGNISRLIYGYRFLGTYTTENLSLGSLGNLCYNIVTAAGFIWVYLFFHKIVNEKKLSVELFVNSILSIIMCLLKGGREKAIQIIAAGFLYYLMFNIIRNKSRKELSPKQFAIVTMLGLAIMGTFQSLGTFLGRTVQADFSQYIAVYLSGSIRNLDVYIRNPWGTSDIFGKMSFIRIINYLGGKLNNSNWIYPLDLPYQAANGKNSGNIYTTFYAFLYDFGSIGVVVMPFFIGLITNLCYKNAQKNLKKNNNKIQFSLLVYGYWYYTLIFSYFSNKFYEMTCTITFIRNIVIWAFLIYILKRIRIGRTKDI